MKLGRKARVLAVSVAVLLTTAHKAGAQSGTTCPSPLIFDESAVDECLGNCGAGCSNDNHWWCNEGTGWVIDELYGSEEFLYYTGSIEYCDGEYRCTSTCGMYRLPGQFTYWGWYASGCYVHDEWCREHNPWCWVPPPGFILTICLGQEERSWTYTGYAHAVNIMDTQCEYAWPECPEVANATAPPPKKKTVQAGKGGGS